MRTIRKEQSVFSVNIQNALGGRFGVVESFPDFGPIKKWSDVPQKVLKTLN